MPKKTKPAAAPRVKQVKLTFPEDSYTMKRRKTIRENRQPNNRKSFESHLEEYVEKARKNFRLGLFWNAWVWNDHGKITDHEKGWRRLERVELFEAKQRAARNAARKVA